MRREVKGIEKTLEVLKSFHLTWSELNEIKQKTARNNHGFLAIAGTVVLNTTMKSKMNFPST